jgi:hypothetical protein
MTTPIIASLSIDAISAGGEAFAIKVEIGTPYHCETGEWACPFAVWGLQERLRDARGEESFQALCMAISRVLDMLDDFREKGGKLLTEQQNFPLEAYAFGPAIRKPV